MNRMIEVEIDDKGIHPVVQGTHLPPGRAILIWPVPEAALGLIMSEQSLAKDWLRAEEDAAWAYLQPPATLSP